MLDLAGAELGEHTALEVTRREGRLERCQPTIDDPHFAQILPTFFAQLVPTFEITVAVADDVLRRRLQRKVRRGKGQI